MKNNEITTVSWIKLKEINKQDNHVSVQYMYCTSYSTGVLLSKQSKVTYN